MENTKTELLSNKTKRQKVETDETQCRNWTDTLMSDDSLENDKLEKERNYLTDTKKFFPELVWKEVLKKIDGMDDIESCTNSSSYFGTILARERYDKVVLPQVFGILANLYYDPVKCFTEVNLGFTCSTTKEEIYVFPKTDLINCRRVCKSWNMAIEEIHQDQNVGHFSMGGGFENPKNQILDFAHEFDEHNVEKFINHFEATHFDLIDGKSKKCPIIGRSVYMDILGTEIKGENIEAHFSAMTKVLKKWGVEVWYFGFHTKFFRQFQQFVKPYQKLKELVELMPNLRVLGIHFDDQEAFELDLSAQLQNLEDEISINPFPKLFSLRYLLADGLPAPFFDHLIDQHQQITQLNVNSQGLVENSAVFSSGLPNLSKLTLDICSKEDFEIFERANIHMKLSTMQFMYHDYEDYEDRGIDEDFEVPFVSWFRVLTALENKIDSSACTELYLKLPNPTTNAERKSALQDSLSYRLKFPNIKFITFWQATVFSLDFLLLLKNTLSGIKLIRGQSYRTDCSKFRKNRGRENHFREMEIIKFLRHEDNLQKSNISSFLPRLKKLIVSSEYQHVEYSLRHDGVKKKVEYDSVLQEFSSFIY